MSTLALSLKQPWANLVVQGRKTIETRTWSTLHRGPLYIHAGKAFDAAAGQHFGIAPRLLPRGAIIGRVLLVAVDLFTEESWHELRDRHCVPGRFDPPRYAWHMEGAVEFAEPIPCQGSLGLFDVGAVIRRWEARER